MCARGKAEPAAPRAAARKLPQSMSKPAAQVCCLWQDNVMLITRFVRDYDGEGR